MKCLYYQWRISRALDDGDGAALPTAHIDRCPACRAFYEGSRRLAAKMGTAEKGTGTIFANDAKKEPVSISAVRVPIFWFAAVSAAAAAVLLTLAFLQWDHNRRQSETIVIKVPQNPSPAPAVPFAIPSQGEAIAALTAAAKKPFAAELQAASHDAHIAANTVRSLLWIDLRQKPPEPEE